MTSPVKALDKFLPYFKWSRQGLSFPCHKAIYIYKILILFNDFSCKSTGQVFTIFQVEPSVDGILRVCSNGETWLTKMAALLLYSKKHTKIFIGTKKALKLSIGI